jgi:hypothetical protein
MRRYISTFSSIYRQIRARQFRNSQPSWLWPFACFYSVAGHTERVAPSSTTRTL